MAAKWGSVRLLRSVLTSSEEWLLVWARDVGLWMPAGAGANEGRAPMPTGVGANADGGGRNTTLRTLHWLEPQAEWALR